MRYNHTLLDGPHWFNEIQGRHLLQKERTDYEGKILYKIFYEDMTDGEAKKKVREYF